MNFEEFGRRLEDMFVTGELMNGNLARLAVAAERLATATERLAAEQHAGNEIQRELVAAMRAGER